MHLQCTSTGGDREYPKVSNWKKLIIKIMSVHNRLNIAFGLIDCELMQPVDRNAGDTNSVDHINSFMINIILQWK